MSDDVVLVVSTQQGDGGADASTARIVRAILEYSRWPKGADPVRLCVIGTAQNADGLDTITLPDGRRVVMRALASEAVDMPGRCDAFYLGAMDLGAMRQWTARARGAAIVTIAERDPQCRSEAMFCLVYRPGTVTFRLNIDAVARSGVRVDPRVLRMAKGG
ncbi:YfiR family protein [Erythrobacter sp. SG61-1L]|uniref:YfiR family protein n=1 Tax=Erythrobacter sp. SG61-1L TaxID=1603897 RepID=UPI00138F8921|nr:YfiR family protein [Erythrobacter sp. SG61-1L]